MVLIEKSFPRGGHVVKSSTATSDKHKFGAKVVKKVTGVNKNKKQKEKKKKRKKAAEKGLVAKSVVPISRKTIQEGMLVMGFITEIEKTHLNISLPGKLKGTVKVTSISEAYTEALTQLMESKGTIDKITQLDDLFTVGQSVYCKVVGFPAEGSKYFNLSLNPKDLHSEFTHSNLNKGMSLTGALVSWEDHGAVVDLGIANTRCFLTRSPKTSGLNVGQLIICRIDEITKTPSTANVKLSVSEEKDREVEFDTVEKLDYLVPTSVVSLTILNNSLRNGLSGKILDGQFDGFINEQHLGAGKTVRDFEIGQDVLATVLYVMPLTKFVYLTLNTFVPQEKRLEEGKVFENVTVLGVHSAGVLLRLDKNSTGLLSVIHMKAVGNRGETSLEDLQRKYDNSVKQVRIINYDPMDGVYLCTDDAKLITEKYFRLSDVSVGQLVKCRVKEPLKTHGVLVKIGQLNGFIYKLHLCKTLTKSRAGATIKARVLYLDEAKQSVHLTTLKEYMRAPESSLLVDRDSVEVGGDYVGTVTSVTPKLIYVEFLNKIVGTLRNVTDRSRPLGSQPKYAVGMVMPFNVSAVEGTRIRLDAGQQKAAHKSGELVEGTVTGAYEKGLQLEVPGKSGDTVSIWVDKDFLTEFPELRSAMGPSYKVGESVTLITLNSSTYSARDVDAFKRYPMLARHSLSPNKNLRAIVLRADPSALVVQVPLKDGAMTQKLPYNVVLVNEQVKNKSALFTQNQVIYVNVTGTVGKMATTLPLNARLDMTFSGNGHATINYLKDYLTQLDRVQRPMFEANDFKWRVGSQVDGTVSKVLVAGKEYEVQFNESFMGNLRTEEKLSLKDNVRCTITWVDEAGRIYLSNDVRLNEELDQSQSLLRFHAKNEGFILHKTKYCYVVLLVKFNQLVFVPIRLHYNDFQPTLDNRTGDCSVVVMHATVDRTLGLFSDVYDKMLKLGMKPVKLLKRPLYLKDEKEEQDEEDIEDVDEEEGETSDEEEEEGGDDDEEEDDDDDEEAEEEEDAEPEIEEPKKKKLKPSPSTEEPIVPDNKSAMANFWSMDFDTVQSNKPSDFDMDVDEDEEDNAEGKKKKAQKQGPSETDIRNLEEALATSANIPSSTAEFERLVLATPNNSLIWIKFMVFHLQALEVDKARAVFRRALKAINFRWQDDILNVWVAYLNLELRYGQPENFDQAFSEALSTNDQFKVTMRTIEILADSDKIALCKAKTTVAMKKFKERVELWPKIAAAYFRMGLKEEANQLLNKALAVLDKRDHLQVIVEFAKLNRANGQLDVASTLLEQILTSYPKRTDIWSFYIDMLIKEDQVESARSILERATSQKLPAKKMKTLFKKYLDFEERFGDEKAVEHVKQLAAEYVQTQQ